MHKRKAKQGVQAKSAISMKPLERTDLSPLQHGTEDFGNSQVRRSVSEIQAVK
jgi:hypothetical protein